MLSCSYWETCAYLFPHPTCWCKHLYSCACEVLWDILQFIPQHAAMHSVTQASVCTDAAARLVWVCFCFCASSGTRLLQPAQVCDVLKGLILVLCFSMTHYVDYSMMYHLIRGQSVIKLYIIYNMLEVLQTLGYIWASFATTPPEIWTVSCKDVLWKQRLIQIQRVSFTTCDFSFVHIKLSLTQWKQ